MTKAGLVAGCVCMYFAVGQQELSWRRPCTIQKECSVVP